MSIGLGSSIVTIGLLTGLPAVVGPLVSMVASAVDLRKYLDSRQEVEIGDMFVLWRVMRKGQMHA
ncbi:hypothetical protein ACFFRB_01770 [Kibdelosporangium aridum subsp. largum]